MSARATTRVPGDVHTAQWTTDRQWRGAWRQSKCDEHLTLSSASSFSSCAFSCLTVSSSAFKCSTSSALDAFRYCLMKLQNTTQCGPHHQRQRVGRRSCSRSCAHGRGQCHSLQRIRRLLAGLVERHQHCNHQARGGGHWRSSTARQRTQGRAGQGIARHSTARQACPASALCDSLTLR